MMTPIKNKPSSTRLFLVVIALALSSFACTTLMEPFQNFGVDPTPTVILVVPTRAPRPTATEEPTPDQPEPSATTEQVLEATLAPSGEEDVEPPDSLGDLFETYWQTREIIHANFVDQPVDDQLYMQGGMEAIQAITVTAGMEAPLALNPSDETVRNFARSANTPSELLDLYLPFWKAWITSPAPKDADLMQAAIRGSIDSLGDEHTSYMDPDQFRQASIPLEGEYEGIGAWVDANEEYLTIVSPMPDSPAEAAGLQPGDEIIKVDGDDMTGIDGNLVIRRVLGAAGSQVLLTIRREGEAELFDVTVTRAKIIIPSADGRMLENNIAYVQLFRFADDSRDDLRSYLEDLLSQNPVGLILDLRNNGGGYLNSAVEIASEFIKADQVVLYELYGDNSRETFTTIEGGLATDIPMVVLVNEGSASASEIVAGAIQDYGRALLVGTTTFGKGSVQQWLALPDEGSVRVTVARWYTPEGRLIHEVGLEPDVAVEITEEDIAAEADPQLDEAIRILLQNP